MLLTHICNIGLKYILRSLSELRMLPHDLIQALPFQALFIAETLCTLLQIRHTHPIELLCKLHLQRSAQKCLQDRSRYVPLQAPIGWVHLTRIRRKLLYELLYTTSTLFSHIPQKSLDLPHTDPKHLQPSSRDKSPSIQLRDMSLLKKWLNRLHPLAFWIRVNHPLQSDIFVQPNTP
jgi:hypothetical protein